MTYSLGKWLVSVLAAGASGDAWHSSWGNKQGTANEGGNHCVRCKTKCFFLPSCYAKHKHKCQHQSCTDKQKHSCHKRKKPTLSPKQRVGAEVSQVHPKRESPHLWNAYVCKHFICTISMLTAMRKKMLIAVTAIGRRQEF